MLNGTESCSWTIIHLLSILRHDALSLEALDPFGDGLRRGVELARCGSLAQPAVHNGADHVLSTFGCEAGIVVGVIRSPGESLTSGDITEWTTS